MDESGGWRRRALIEEGKDRGRDRRAGRRPHLIAPVFGCRADEESVGGAAAAVGGAPRAHWQPAAIRPRAYADSRRDSARLATLRAAAPAGPPAARHAALRAARIRQQWGQRRRGKQQNQQAADGPARASGGFQELRPAVTPSKPSTDVSLPSLAASGSVLCRDCTPPHTSYVSAWLAGLLSLDRPGTLNKQPRMNAD